VKIESWINNYLLLNSVQSGFDVRAEKRRNKVRGDETGIPVDSWPRSDGDWKTESRLGESKAVVLRTSQTKVAVDRWEQ